MKDVFLQQIDVDEIGP